MAIRRKYLISLLCAAALAAVGCGTGSGAATRDRDEVPVEVVNIAFAPASIEIKSGTTVLWTNKDEGVRHTVTSGLPGDGGVPGVRDPEPPQADGIFDGDLADASADFTFTFTDVGAYAYFCRVHPSMTGEVIVD